MDMLVQIEHLGIVAAGIKLKVSSNQYSSKAVLKTAVTELDDAMDRMITKLNMSYKALLGESICQEKLIIAMTDICKMVDVIRDTKKNFKPFMNSTSLKKKCLVLEEKAVKCKSNFTLSVQIYGDSDVKGVTGAKVLVSDTIGIINTNQTGVILQGRPPSYIN